MKKIPASWPWKALPGSLAKGLVFGVALGLVGYALVRFLKGRTTYRDEMVRYERMMAIRRDLKLDDPAALLPQR